MAPRPRYVRYRELRRLRYSRRFKRWLSEQADRLETTPDVIFEELLLNQRLTFRQVENLGEISLHIAGNFPANITEGEEFSFTYSIVGGTPPYDVSGSGPLPPGITHNAATRTFSGTATQIGDWNYTVSVEDDDGETASRVFTFVVQAAEPGPEPEPGDEAPLASINVDGWSAEWDGTPEDIGDYVITVDQQGYSALGTATVVREQIPFGLRVQKSYPLNEEFEPSRVSLQRRVYLGSTVLGGVVNNSALTSPKPIFAWTCIDREVVGGTIEVAAMAWHIKGIAAIRYSFSDGVNTLDHVVHTVTARVTRSGNAILEYKSGPVDISSLTNGLVTVSAIAYPKIGVDVFDTSEISDVKDQRNLYFRKHPALLADPVIVYLAPDGDNGTGAASLDDAVAKSAPFASRTEAFAAAIALNNSTYGVNALDGVRVRLAAGTEWVPGFATRAQLIAAPVIEPSTDAVGRMPLAIPAAMNFFMAGKDSEVPDQAVLMQRFEMTGHSGSLLSNQAAACVFSLRDCDLDLSAATAGNVTQTTTSGVRMVDCVITGAPVAFSYLSGSSPVVMMHGCSSTDNLNDGQIPAFNVQGCAFLGGRLIFSSVFAHQAIVAQTSIAHYLPDLLAVIQDSPGVMGRGVVLANSAFEETASRGRKFWELASDGTTYNSNHVLIWHTAVAGYGDCCRSNICYNDVIGINNQHLNWSIIGYINGGRIPLKSDVYNKDPNGGDYSGNWGVKYGLDCQGNFEGMMPNSGQDKRFFGERSVWSQNPAVEYDPMWVFNGASVDTSMVPTVGGTDWHLQPGSLARDIVHDSPLPFDMVGNPRGAISHAGCYA